MRQRGAGQFRSDLAVRCTEQAELFADRFNKGVSIYLEPPKGSVGILFPRTASGQFLTCGINVGNEKMVVIPDGTGVDIQIPDLSGSECIGIPQARFIAMTEVLCPTFIRPEGLGVFEGNTAQQRHLRKAVINMVSYPELEPNDEQLSNLLAATIAWIADCTSQRRQSEGLHVNGARIRVAKLAQKYIEEHYYETIRMEDLCSVTGVGLRTLQRCFREYFDITISDYLKTVRLSAAHRELAVAHPSERTVANIALQSGFTHLGRFSVEFHERFGRTPKETLAIQAGQKS